MTYSYTETVYRYRVVRIEKLPASHAAEHRINGNEDILHNDPMLGPDCTRSLVWSFKDRADAEAQAARDNDNAPAFWRFEVVDAGADETIERVVGF